MSLSTVKLFKGLDDEHTSRPHLWTIKVWPNSSYVWAYNLISFFMRKKKGRQHVPQKTTCLSQEQVQHLLAHVRERADQARLAGATRAIVDELVILILLQTGLRPQELRSLRIADTPAHHGKPHLQVRNNSGVTDRMVTVSQEMDRMLQRYVHLYRANAQATDLLILSERGTPFGYISLYSKVRRIGQEAGLGRLSPAMLRHTFLVRLYEKEQDLRLVQEQAGHARLKSTARQVRPCRPAPRCDACNRTIAPGTGETIDSGQLLCPSCLRDLRTR
jgi:integrase/recombinase XerD